VIEVVEPGALTSVQTASGRPGWRHLGVTVGGAADAWSARLANRLVGNPDDAPLLEITLVGPVLRFTAAASIAMAGTPFEATLDSVVVSPHTGHSVRAGSMLRMGSGDGARAYLAVGGGIQVEDVLGSAATDLRTGFGGHEGRALRAGDRLEVRESGGALRRWTGTPPAGAIRMVDGPHADASAISALVDGTWTTSTAADRAGVRLQGEPITTSVTEVASIGLPLGAIQVPPDGRPIVMLADRPVTGGYPVPACVVRADEGRIAQLRPGDAVRFTSVSIEEAREANRRAELELEALEELTPPDAELGWTGALE
jgi:5-oxoprolinase (ATP-hydrolysing) subunit C